MDRKTDGQTVGWMDRLTFSYILSTKKKTEREHEAEFTMRTLVAEYIPWTEKLDKDVTKKQKL